MCHTFLKNSWLNVLSFLKSLLDKWDYSFVYNLNYVLMCVFKNPVYVGTAGGAADGVSLPRNNWMLKKASTPKIMVVMKQVIEAPTR